MSIHTLLSLFEQQDQLKAYIRLSQCVYFFNNQDNLKLL